MPVTHGVASSSLVQTANPNRESLSPTGWGIFGLMRCQHDFRREPLAIPTSAHKSLFLLAHPLSTLQRTKPFCMRKILALLLFVPSLCLAQSVTLPYNPDVNADSAITSTDLLGLLPIFGGYFTPDELLIDGMTVNEYLLLLEENGGSLSIEGSAYGQMLFWDGAEWTLVPAGAHGEVLTIEGTTPTWQAPSEDDTPEVGCADQTACNYDASASVNWAPLCVYEDECGVCDGPGAIYECGCADLPEGDCDCDGNQLDALNVCGGTCAADVDGDGICDDGDDCIGEADECGVCNGPGAIYECGCSEPDPAACDCAGNTLDAVGVCGGGCTEDADGDGICDTEDDCVGEYDFCGVCNGPGPILGCGCEDIPDGYCDCNGNVLDAVGTCGGACQNDFNGDGICDDDSIPGCTYEVACNYDPSASIYDGSCDFTSCYGCTDPAACNYSPAATFDNGVCWYAQASYDCDYNCLIDTDGDGICDDLEIFGCTLEDACNFEPGATELDDSCQYLDECGECGGTGTLGCTDSTACNFNPEAVCDDGSCATDGEVGCLDDEACNFNPDAICSDGSCTYPGCNNPLADNYDGAAGCDDGTCVVYGCTVDLACNYEPTANIDDNSCEFGTCPGCNDPASWNYNPTSSNDSLCIFTGASNQVELEYTGYLQMVVVPAETNAIALEIGGARGGNTGGFSGGSGAFFQLVVDRNLVPDTLVVLVGGHGGDDLSGGCQGGAGGGGGGTFIASTIDDPLFVAGGGGGASGSNGKPGLTSTCGGEGDGCEASNCDGYGGESAQYCGSGAGGGGGFFSQGSSTGYYGYTAGEAFVDGGSGGPAACCDIYGGYGGGAGSHNCNLGGGAGGGYSGGSAPEHNGGQLGGGGGSFILSGAEVFESIDGGNTLSNGYVKMWFLE